VRGKRQALSLSSAPPLIYTASMAQSADDGTPRWLYRLENFSRAHLLLREAVELMSTRPLSALEQEGLIQRFEYTWELAWKTLADYLAAQGVTLETITPRSVLRAAFTARIIDDGEGWMAALDARNRMAHTYSRRAFESVAADIRDRYLALLEDMHMTLLDRRATETALG
jgi:nucleotidyltransferase substrate binding protein (TIGR01987 family)